jgi:hypothetical protein
LAVASAAQLSLYSGYAYPSLYSTGLTYTYPTVYSRPLLYNNEANLEDVEKVFDLTANFINKLKDNPSTETRTKRSPYLPGFSIPTVTIPARTVPAETLPVASIPARTVPAGGISFL